MSDHRDRRSVLRAGAAFCSLSLAGCLGVIDDGGDSGNETDSGNSSDGGNVSDDTDGNDSDGGENGGDSDWETIETWPQLQYDAHNTGYVHAEAPTDVEELWSVETNEGVDTSPVVADGTVYVRDKPGTVYAIEEGTIDWTAEISVDGSTEGTPVIHKDLLVAPIDGGLAGVERDGGSVRWEHSIEDQPRRLTLSDGTVYLANWSNEMYAVEATTGEQRWVQTSGSGGGFYGTPAVYEEDVIVPRGGGGRDAPPEIRALNVEDGLGRPLIQPDVPINTGISIRDDTFHLGADDGVYAFDPESEEQLWHYGTDKPVDKMLAVSPNAVFAITSGSNARGNLYRIDKGSGDSPWSVEVESSSFKTSPIIVGGQVASQSTIRDVQVWDARNGAEEWTVKTKLGSLSTLAFVDGVYYGSSIRGTVYAWG